MCMGGVTSILLLTTAGTAQTAVDEDDMHSNSSSGACNLKQLCSPATGVAL